MLRPLENKATKVTNGHEQIKSCMTSVRVSSKCLGMYIGLLFEKVVGRLISAKFVNPIFNLKFLQYGKISVVSGIAG